MVEKIPTQECPLKICPFQGFWNFSGWTHFHLKLLPCNSRVYEKILQYDFYQINFNNTEKFYYTYYFTVNMTPLVQWADWWDMKVPDNNLTSKVVLMALRCVSLCTGKTQEFSLVSKFSSCPPKRLTSDQFFSTVILLFLIQIDHHFITRWAKPTTLSITVPFRFFTIAWQLVHDFSTWLNV